MSCCRLISVQMLCFCHFFSLSRSLAFFPSSFTFHFHLNNSFIICNTSFFLLPLPCSMCRELVVSRLTLVSCINFRIDLMRTALITISSGKKVKQDRQTRKNIQRAKLFACLNFRSSVSDISVLSSNQCVCDSIKDRFRD